jgi:hypothetical protein
MQFIKKNLSLNNLKILNLNPLNNHIVYILSEEWIHFIIDSDSSLELAVCY